MPGVGLLLLLLLMMMMLMSHTNVTENTLFGSRDSRNRLTAFSKSCLSVSAFSRCAPCLLFQVLTGFLLAVLFLLFRVAAGFCPALCRSCTSARARCSTIYGRWCSVSWSPTPGKLPGEGTERALAIGQMLDPHLLT